MKKSVLKMLNKNLSEKIAELKLISAKTRQRLKQDGHKTIEIEYASSTPDIDLSRNIPMLKKMIEKYKEKISEVEKTGEYGTCKDCLGEISFGRLEKNPIADQCTECKSEREKKQKKIRNRGFIKGDGLAYL